METCLILSGKFSRDPVAYRCRLIELAQEDRRKRHVDASGNALRERKPQEVSQFMVRLSCRVQVDQPLERLLVCCVCSGRRTGRSLA
jgi:hypothetical protein